MTSKLRVAVIGAGRWSAEAHLPGWQRSPLCELVTICDLDTGAGQNQGPRSSARRRRNRITGKC